MVLEVKDLAGRGETLAERLKQLTAAGVSRGAAATILRASDMHWRRGAKSFVR